MKRNDQNGLRILQDGSAFIAVTQSSCTLSTGLRLPALESAEAFQKETGWVVASIMATVTPVKVPLAH